MKTGTFILTFLSSALIAAVSCGPPDPPDPVLTELEKLPPPTKEGLNTFGCLLNGVAKIEQFGGFDAAEYSGRWFSLYVKIKDKSTNSGLYLSMLHNDLASGEYTLNDTTIIKVLGDSFFDGKKPVKFADEYNGKGYASLWNNKNDCKYYTYGEYGEGRLTITHLDTVKYIVSGTFEFTIAAPGCDTLRVTDGRFDMKYIPGYIRGSGG